ncbi:beige/beach-related [Anaeramoeba flamelloides]|uniref:Beige/beach-related n=1 Tax=Anaeramoeba flamelloides TaxID=1746091 RepID=A0AAV8A0X0_9EUKA|nr:beige/beach-related [Anaeramoeba flamelloides]
MIFQLIAIHILNNILLRLLKKNNILQNNNQNFFEKENNNEIHDTSEKSLLSMKEFSKNILKLAKFLNRFIIFIDSHLTQIYSDLIINNSLPIFRIILNSLNLIQNKSRQAKQQGKKEIDFQYINIYLITNFLKMFHKFDLFQYGIKMIPGNKKKTIIYLLNLYFYLIFNQKLDFINFKFYLKKYFFILLNISKIKLLSENLDQTIFLNFYKLIKLYKKINNHLEKKINKLKSIQSLQEDKEIKGGETKGKYGEIDDKQIKNTKEEVNVHKKTEKEFELEKKIKNNEKKLKLLKNIIFELILKYYSNFNKLIKRGINDNVNKTNLLPKKKKQFETKFEEIFNSLIKKEKKWNSFIFKLKKIWKVSLNFSKQAWEQSSIKNNFIIDNKKNNMILDSNNKQEMISFQNWNQIELKFDKIWNNKLKKKMKNNQINHYLLRKLMNNLTAHINILKEDNNKFHYNYKLGNYEDNKRRKRRLKNKYYYFRKPNIININSQKNSNINENRLDLVFIKNDNLNSNLLDFKQTNNNFDKLNFGDNLNRINSNSSNGSGSGSGNSNSSNGSISSSGISNISSGNSNSRTRDSKFIEEFSCEMIKPMKVLKGKLIITTLRLEFLLKKQNFGYKNYWIWKLDNIKKILPRRYGLQQTAIEFFLKNGKSYFFHFKNSKNVKNSKNSKNSIRNNVLIQLFSLKKLFKIKLITTDPRKILKKSGVTKMWQKRAITNFEYLMKINTFAGRTYNDLAQYPIFPWVIKDYASESIDLNDPNVYRDLSKPIGALNLERFDEFKTKYLFCKNDPNQQTPAYFYGTHYSSIYFVLYYLIRLEPFTSLLIEHQGGKLDKSDRTFHSIQITWENCLNDTGDLKELIPEFYYLPEFLENLNHVNLGTKQNKEIVNNVKLPPWANNSTEEFVRIMNDALESDYVSEHLNEWIDLIFGYKQRGEEAVKANNVFYYLTYEQNINLDQIDDPIFRKSIKSQIQNFGQCPIQLFTQPHPKRNKKNQNDPDKDQNTNNSNLINSSSMIINNLNLQRNNQNNNNNLITFGKQISEKAIIFLSFMELSNHINLIGFSDQLLLIDQDKQLYFSKWITQQSNQKKNMEKGIPNFTLNIHSDKKSKKKKIKQKFSSKISNFNKCFAINKNCDLLFVCGFYKKFSSIYNIKNFKVIQILNKHIDITTCLALDDTNSYLLIGSRDTTVSVWKIKSEENSKINIHFSHLLVGQDDTITCLDVNVNSNLIVTGSKGKTLMLYNLFNYRYFKTIFFKSPIINVKIIPGIGKIVSFLKNKILLVHTINGKFLKKIQIDFKINCWLSTNDEKLLFLAGENGLVEIRLISDLSLIKRYQIKGNICSMTLSVNQKFLFLGLMNGKLLISQI